MATSINMENIQNDIDVRLPKSLKDNTNLIEWNVDMKVTVSSVKKSKVFQRSRCIIFVLMAIVFTIVLSHLGREMRALQVQIQSVNVNLLVLMSKYDRLNRSLNRAWFHRNEGTTVHKMKPYLDRATSLSKTVEIFEGIRNATSGNSYAYNSIVTILNPIRSVQDKRLLNNIPAANKENNSTVLEALMKIENEEKRGNKDKSNLRIERAILTRENDGRLYRGEFRRDNDDDNDNDDTDLWREPRSGRTRRDEGRGKKRGKNKRRPKRNRRRLGPLVATFVGAIPEQHVTNAVHIGPWIKSANNSTQYSLNKFHLVEDKKSIEVTMTGLYMISVQIFYFGEPTNYSYWILLSSEGKSTTQRLAKCSTASSTSATEVSCYTSVVTALQKGDRIHIQQQERDRLINMREGHSYIQLVLLSNNVRRRRK